jgi:hypothetical protein
MTHAIGQAVEWPADNVQRVAVDRLRPYPNSTRTHSRAQVAQLVASIQEWGWTTPVLVDEQGMLIPGQARLEAAKQLGIPEIPVMVARLDGGTSPGLHHRRQRAPADGPLGRNAAQGRDQGNRR